MRQKDVGAVAVAAGRMHDVASQQSSKLNNATLVATMPTLRYTQRNLTGAKRTNVNISYSGYIFPKKNYDTYVNMIAVTLSKIIIIFKKNV